ncbi:MAG TPA: hypothetical protein PLD19_08160 [Luteimonas sp.]|nr:hypothetical protein [Luteimonas sp.]
MHFQRSNIPDLDTCPPQTIQTYLEAVAALSIKHGLVIDFANVMPTYPGVGGYCLTRCGYLRVYAHDELPVEAVTRERLLAEPEDPRHHTYIADFASMSAHDRLRLLGDSR